MAGKINNWASFQQFMDDCCVKVGADPDFAPHSRWWREMDYNKFMTDGTVQGERIVAPGDAENSRVIQALEGRPPFGPGERWRQMPPGTHFEQTDIDEIRDWIARGCPDDSSTLARK